jgi:polysaccharide biosynthesis transport protein
MSRITRALRKAGDASSLAAGHDQSGASVPPWEIAADEEGPPSATGRGPGQAGSRPRVPAVYVPAPPPASGSGWDSPPPMANPPLARYWDVIRRRWGTGAILFAVVIGGVTAGALLRTPVYRASALLEIRADSAGAVPVESLFSLDDKMPSDELETQYGILRSRTLAERVVADMDRYTAAAQAAVAAQAAKAAAAQAAKSGGAAAQPPAKQASPPAAAPPNPDEVDDFRTALVVNPQRGSRLVELEYVSPDPKLAAFTVNSVLDNYLRIRMDDAQRSAKWLEEQIQDAQHRLEASEHQLQAYLRGHGVDAIETGKGETAQLANDRLKALRDALGQAQAQRMDRQAQADEVSRVAANGGVDGPVAQQLTVKLAELRREHARLTATFRDDYPAVKAVNDQIAEAERALAEEARAVISRGQRDYRAALAKEGLLQKALDEQSAVVRALNEGGTAGGVGYEALKRDLVTNQEQFAALGDKLKQVRISAALKAANVGIVDRAVPPAETDGLSLPLTLILAAIVGVCVGGGGIFLRDLLDTSMRSFTEIEATLGVRPLAAIPAVGQPSRMLPRRRIATAGEWRRIDDGGGARSPLGDAFAALRNAVLLQDGYAASRVLLVTSAQSAEGKTTVSLNLALSLARLRYRTLLVDGNLRYPCLQEALGLPDRSGLSDYLASGLDWRGCVHSDVRPKLDVLAGGASQGSPADLLSMTAMGELLDAAAREYDFVVVDSPAVLHHLADVRSLSAVADSVIFTIRHGSTRREDVTLALSQLDRVAGVVLNRAVGADVALAEPDPARTRLAS